MSDDMEIIIVQEISGDLASVQLPDTSLEVWPLTALPAGVAAGDHVGVTINGGLRVTVLLPRPSGLLA